VGRMSTGLMSISMDPWGTDDCGLIGRIARGDAGALASLVALYEPRVRRLAHRLMAWDGELDDVVQDVFLAVLEKAGGFRGDASAWTWLTAITLNRCRTYRRRRAVRERVGALLGRHRAAERAADQPALDQEVAREVRAAVAALPGRDREVIVLFYLEHKPAAEIGDLLGVSQNAVEVRLHRARGRLKVRLDGFVKGVKS